MKIDNEFTVSVPVELAWQALTDLAEVSLCLPGARLTGVEGEVYSGEVRVKVGPVISEYSGTAQFATKDDESYRAVIDAKGKDSRGAGNASAVITMQLEAHGLRTVVKVDTDLKLSGKIAQLGGGMIAEVSQKLLGQFADCLEAKLAATESSESSEIPEGETTSEIQEAATPSEIPDGGPSATPEAATPSETPTVGAPPATAPAAMSAGPAAPEPLDLMSLAASSMLKRAVPLLLVLLALLALVVYLLAR